MLYEPEREFLSERPYDLEDHSDFQVDYRQIRVVPRDNLPLRPRADSSVTDATLISAPSTSSTTSISPDRDDSFEISSASSYDSDSEPPEQHQHPRRTSHGAAPPPLRRSDDKQRIFVEGLLAVTTSFVETIWPLSRETPRSSTEFNGAGVLPLRTFIQETCRRSKTSYSTLQIALYYLVLLKDVLTGQDFTREQQRESKIDDRVPKDPQVLLGQPTGPSGCRVMQCGRRMFMSALMLAAKYLQDRNFSVKAWAKLSGLNCLEINQNEKAYLQSIEYRLHLKKEYFDNWSQIVLVLCSYAKTQGSLDYLKIIRCLNLEVIRDPANTKHLLKEIGGRYHTGCSHQSESFYSDDNNPGSQSLRISNNSISTRAPLMQTRGKAMLRADVDTAIRASAQVNDHVPLASKHTCPPPQRACMRRPLRAELLQASVREMLRNARSVPDVTDSPGSDDTMISAIDVSWPPSRPVNSSVSTALAPPSMQRLLDGQYVQAPLHQILHNSRPGPAISISSRFDDNIAIASNVNCLPQPPRPQENTGASKALGQHVKPPPDTTSVYEVS